MIQELFGLIDPEDENMMILANIVHYTILQIRKLNLCLEYKLLQRILVNFCLYSHAVTIL